MAVQTVLIQTATNTIPQQILSAITQHSAHKVAITSYQGPSVGNWYFDMHTMHIDYDAYYTLDALIKQVTTAQNIDLEVRTNVDSGDTVDLTMYCLDI